MKKTLDIRTLLDLVNDRLALSTDDAAGRYSLCMLIETVLQDADVYKGYTSLGFDAVPKGHLPGVMKREDFIVAVHDGKFDLAAPFDTAEIINRGVSGNVFPDESRRNYIVHPHLAAKSKSLFMPSGA